MSEMFYDDVMVLCCRCKEDYLEAGYQVRAANYNGLKEECTKCNRQGFSYHVYKNQSPVPKARIFITQARSTLEAGLAERRLICV